MSREDVPNTRDPADGWRPERRKRLCILLTLANWSRFTLRLKSDVGSTTVAAAIVAAVLGLLTVSSTLSAQTPAPTPAPASKPASNSTSNPALKKSPPAIAWKTGNEFRTALESPIGVTWSGSPLRPSLQRLAKEFRVAMWLDRRIDPGQSIELSIANEGLDIGCQRLATRLNAGVGRVGSVVYFGPTYTTERLATVAALRRAEIERLPAADQMRLAASRSLRWDDLAEPRELVRMLAVEGGLEVSNLERALPHDLWPAAELPSLAWSDRLSLLLANFDLTFSVDTSQRRLDLTPFPEAPRVDKLLVVKGAAAQVAADWTDRFPQAEVRVMGAKIAVRARFEDLEIMERVARGERVERARVVAGPSEFTLTVENQPAGAILRHIAKQLKLTLEVAPEAVEPLEKLVSVKADRLRLDDLLAAVLRDTGLRCDREDDRLRVSRR
jgi:hypothetical protein